MAGLQLKYFVLKPDSASEFGHASREALKTYANLIKHIEPDLYDDLLNWIDSINERISLNLEENI